MSEFDKVRRARATTKPAPPAPAPSPAPSVEPVATAEQQPVVRVYGVPSEYIGSGFANVVNLTADTLTQLSEEGDVAHGVLLGESAALCVEAYTGIPTKPGAGGDRPLRPWQHLLVSLGRYTWRAFVRTNEGVGEWMRRRYKALVGRIFRRGKKGDAHEALPEAPEGVQAPLTAENAPPVEDAPAARTRVKKARRRGR